MLLLAFSMENAMVYCPAIMSVYHPREWISIGFSQTQIIIIIGLRLKLGMAYSQLTNNLQLVRAWVDASLGKYF